MGQQVEAPPHLRGNNDKEFVKQIDNRLVGINQRRSVFSLDWVNNAVIRFTRAGKVRGSVSDRQNDLASSSDPFPLRHKEGEGTEGGGSLQFHQFRSVRVLFPRRASAKAIAPSEPI
jgi:hypothetical protein